MTADVLKLKPSEVYEFITAALLCDHVAYVAGPPAIGKSQIVKQVADDANAKMIDLRLSQILSEDMTGLPERDPKTGKAVYLPFETFPLESDEIPDGYSGWILFLDELSSASEEVLAASYSLILDRTVGGKRLHPKCRVVAAGNRASDSAIARELPDTLITRMLPIEMKVNQKDWVRWAENHAETNEAVLAFIEKNPSMLYAPIKTQDRAELETFPTPRGWEKVFKHMNFFEANVSEEPLSDLVFNLICASVGSLAARSFREEYDESIQIPFPFEVVHSPSTVQVPQTNTSKVQLTVDLAKHYLECGDQERDALLIYMNRIGGEYSELFVNNIKAGLGTTPSEQKLVERICKRLSIDPLLGTAPKGGSSKDPDDAPF